MKFKYNYKFQNPLFIIIIILGFLFFLFTYLNYIFKINKVNNKINTKIEPFNNYYSLSDPPENLCYFDNVKNEIDQNYDVQDLKFNLYNCMDYINPDGCGSSNLADQLQYIKDNMNNAYYDSTINSAFSCNCFKLMNIQYSGLEPEIKKLVDEIQALKSSTFSTKDNSNVNNNVNNNNLNEINQDDLLKNPDDLNCYLKYTIVDWCTQNQELNDNSRSKCPIILNNFKEKCPELAINANNQSTTPLQKENNANTKINNTNNLNQINQYDLIKNPDDLNCYTKNKIINWCESNLKLNSITQEKCPIIINNYQEKCDNLVGTLKKIKEDYFEKAYTDKKDVPQYEPITGSVIL
jgi:hypothetical protein